jgi:hypothetical protein
MTHNESGPNIVVQTLGVTYAHMPPGPEVLRYAPGALMEGMPDPDTIDVPMSALLLRRQIVEIRQAVEELLWRARLGNRREGRGLEAAAGALARQILPASRFGALVRPGLHPQFLIERDLASEVPWEVFDDPDGGSGKLSVDRYLTYRVRGGQPPQRAGNVFLVIEDPTQDVCDQAVDAHGRCAAHLRQLKEMLAQHGYRVWELKRRNATVARVKSALQNPEVVGLYFFGHGYFPEQGSEGCLALADGPLLAREIEAAQSDIRFVFLNACQIASRGEQHWGLERKSNSVAEMFARGGLEKTVIAPLFPVVNAQAATAASRFFTLALNGQTLGESLRITRSESLQRYENDLPDVTWAAYRHFGDPRRSLPRGDRKDRTTVAGAEMPLEVRVFRGDERELDLDLFAFQLQPVLFRAAKRRSLQRRRDVTLADLLAGLLRSGELTRFAMRRQNRDPDELYELMLTTVEIGAPGPEPEVVDSRGTATTTADDATPQCKADGSEGESSVRKLLAELERLFGRFRVEYERQFAPPAAKALRCADVRAQRRGGPSSDHLITEQDLLLTCMEDERWLIDVEVDLPSVADVRRWLDLPFDRRSVDANGRLVFSVLTPGSRQVIEKAHQQAQQRGVAPIPNRLLLASLLDNPQEFPARCCARHGVDAKNLANALVAATPAKAPKSFDLTHDVCQRVVLPTLERANEYRRQWSLEKIDIPLLFKAYCEVASANFVETLRSPEMRTGMRIDLRAVGELIIPEALSSQDLITATLLNEPFGPRFPANSEGSDGATARIAPISTQGAAEQGLLAPDVDGPLRQALAAAPQIAALQGFAEIRSPHLFVALASYGSPEWRQALDRGPLPRDQLILNMLRVTLPRLQADGATTTIRLGRTVQRVLAEARTAAQRRGAQSTEETDVLRTLLSDRQGKVVQALMAFGYEELLNDLWSGWEKRT